MNVLQHAVSAVQRPLVFVATATIPWKTYVQILSWIITLFEVYLLFRQYPLYSRTIPPRALESHFTPESFVKSQAYGKDKAKFSMVSKLCDETVKSALLQCGAYAWCWQVSGDVVALFAFGKQQEIVQSLVYTTIVFCLIFLHNLPLDIYSTFCLEEKHGFDKTKPVFLSIEWVKDVARGFAFGLPLLAGILKTLKWAGDRLVPWLIAVWLAYLLWKIVLNLMSNEPLLSELSPLPAGELKTRIEALTTELGFPLGNLYKINESKHGSHGNAWFFGPPLRKHIGILDTLIKGRTPEEVEAVIAREIGNWHYQHPIKLSCISQAKILTTIALFPVFLHAPPVFRSFGFPEHVAAQPPTIIGIHFGLLIIPSMVPFITLLHNILNRRLERQADRFALELLVKVQSAEKMEDVADVGERLKRALIGLHVKDLKDPSTAWIDGLYSAYHHSQPTLAERLRALDLLLLRMARKKL